MSVFLPKGRLHSAHKGLGYGCFWLNDKVILVFRLYCRILYVTTDVRTLVLHVNFSLKRGI